MFHGYDEQSELCFRECNFGHGRFYLWRSGQDTEFFVCSVMLDAQ